MSNLLLSNRFKVPGLAIFGITAVFGMLSKYCFTIQSFDYFNEVIITGMISGLLLISFSKEKAEDEYVSQLRLESLQWAVLINYSLLLTASWLVYGLEYLSILFYNMMTILIIFILRFHYVLNKATKSTKL